MKASADTRKSGARHLPVQYLTTRVMAESATAAEGVPKLLQAICESLDCEHGAVWRVDRAANVLRYLSSWHAPGEGFAEFDRASQEMVLPPGMGLPGRVWNNRQPLWLSDVPREGNFPRKPMALLEGVHCAVGFPIMLGGEILGVMEFFSRQVAGARSKGARDPERHRHPGGQFLERNRADEELRASEERFRSLFEEAPVAYHEIDTEGIVRRVNRAEREMLGLEAESIVGRHVWEFVVPGGTRHQPRRGAAQAGAGTADRALRARVPWRATAASITPKSTRA